MVFWRAVVVWLVLIGAETIHGILRTLLLVPAVGDFRARQISVFTGSVVILVIACLFIRWIRAGTTTALILAGPDDPL